METTYTKARGVCEKNGSNAEKAFKAKCREPRWMKEEGESNREQRYLCAPIPL